MDIDLKEELKKRDELLAGYLKQMLILNNQYLFILPHF